MATPVRIANPGDDFSAVVDSSGALKVSLATSTGTSSVNVAQMAGTATAVGSGTTNAGTQRVVIVTDQTAIPATGPTTAGTTLNAVTGNATGTTVDFGGGCSICTTVAVGTSTLAGTLTIEGSLDNTTFVSTGTTVALTAGATVTATSTGKAFRYYRVSLSGASGAGSCTAKVLAAQ